MSKNDTRSLYIIAAEISGDWSTQGRGISPHAEPYLEAMRSLSEITDTYGYDSAADIVRRFLVNAGTWRGEIARRIKAELKALLAGR